MPQASATSSPPAAPPSAAAVLAIEDVTFGYDRERPVVRGLRAALPAGRLTVLLGPNAAGKSTLLRLMLGQLDPWSGFVKLGDTPIGHLRPQERAAAVSYVPQRAATSFSFSVRQVVAMGRHMLRSHPEAIERAMELCEVRGLAQRVFHELSVGQQQRVLLARAVAQSWGGGRAILLDEPSSAMDLAHVHATMRLLRQLAGDGMAVLLVLHDLNLAARFADDVWLMHEGRLVAAGSWQETMDVAVLEGVYRLPLEVLGHDRQGRPVFLADPGGTLSMNPAPGCGLEDA